MYRPHCILKFIIAVLSITLINVGGTASADTLTSGHHRSAGSATAPPVFIASRAKPYDALVDDAMNIMNHGMANAPMNGTVDHDFAAMMIPHHQGAVDMAKAELLYGTNPVLRRLAQEIIVTQGQEIEVMQLQLKNLRTLPADNQDFHGK